MAGSGAEAAVQRKWISQVQTWQHNEVTERQALINPCAGELTCELCAALWPQHWQLLRVGMPAREDSAYAQLRLPTPISSKPPASAPLRPGLDTHLSPSHGAVAAAVAAAEAAPSASS